MGGPAIEFFPSGARNPFLSVATPYEGTVFNQTTKNVDPTKAPAGADTTRAAFVSDVSQFKVGDQFTDPAGQFGMESYNYGDMKYITGSAPHLSGKIKQIDQTGPRFEHLGITDGPGMEHSPTAGFITYEYSATNRANVAKEYYDFQQSLFEHQPSNPFIFRDANLAAEFYNDPASQDALMKSQLPPAEAPAIETPTPDINNKKSGGLKVKRPPATILNSLKPKGKTLTGQ